MDKISEEDVLSDDYEEGEILDEEGGEEEEVSSMEELLEEELVVPPGEEVGVLVAKAGGRHVFRKRKEHLCKASSFCRKERSGKHCYARITRKRAQPPPLLPPPPLPPSQFFHVSPPVPLRKESPAVYFSAPKLYDRAQDNKKQPYSKPNRPHRESELKLPDRKHSEKSQHEKENKYMRQKHLNNFKAPPVPKKPARGRDASRKVSVNAQDSKFRRKSGSRSPVRDVKKPDAKTTQKKRKASDQGNTSLLKRLVGSGSTGVKTPKDNEVFIGPVHPKTDSLEQSHPLQKRNSNSKDQDVSKVVKSEEEEADEDSEMLKLRMEALKTAMLKKHSERKKRGFTGVRKTSTDIIDSIDDYIAEGSQPVSYQNNYPEIQQEIKQEPAIPYVPPPSLDPTYVDYMSYTNFSYCYMAYPHHPYYTDPNAYPVAPTCMTQNLTPVVMETNNQQKPSIQVEEPKVLENNQEKPREVKETKVKIENKVKPIGPLKFTLQPKTTTVCLQKNVLEKLEKRKSKWDDPPPMSTSNENLSVIVEKKEESHVTEAVEKKKEDQVKVTPSNLENKKQEGGISDEEEESEEMKLRKLALMSVRPKTGIEEMNKINRSEKEDPDRIDDMSLVDMDTTEIIVENGPPNASDYPFGCTLNEDGLPSVDLDGTPLPLSKPEISQTLPVTTPDKGKKPESSTVKEKSIEEKERASSPKSSHKSAKQKKVKESKKKKENASKKSKSKSHKESSKKISSAVKVPEIPKVHKKDTPVERKLPKVKSGGLKDVKEDHLMIKSLEKIKPEIKSGTPKVTKEENLEIISQGKIQSDNSKFVDEEKLKTKSLEKIEPELISSDPQVVKEENSKGKSLEKIETEIKSGSPKEVKEENSKVEKIQPATPPVTKPKSDSSRKKEDWEDLDEDILRAQCLSSLAINIPTVNTDNSPKVVSPKVVPVKKNVVSNKQKSQLLPKTVPNPKSNRIVVINEKKVSGPAKKLTDLTVEVRSQQQQQQPQQRFIISVSDDSDTSDDEEEVPIKSVSGSSIQSPITTDIETCVDKLLEEARSKIEADKSIVKIREPKPIPRPLNVAKQIISHKNKTKEKLATIKNSIISLKPAEIKKDASLLATPVAVKHLPASKQKEYRLLKLRIAERERKKELEKLKKRVEELSNKTVLSSKPEKKDVKPVPGSTTPTRNVKVVQAQGREPTEVISNSDSQLSPKPCVVEPINAPDESKSEGSLDLMEIEVEKSEDNTPVLKDFDLLQRSEDSLVKSRVLIDSKLNKMMETVEHIEKDKTEFVSIQQEIVRLKQELFAFEERMMKKTNIMFHRRRALAHFKATISREIKNCLELRKDCLALGLEIKGPNYKPPGDDLEADTEKVREMLHRGESLCEDLCSDEELGKIGEGSPNPSQTEPPNQESNIMVHPQDQLETLFIPLEEDKDSNHQEESCKSVQDAEEGLVKVDDGRCSNNEEHCKLVQEAENVVKVSNDLNNPEINSDNDSSCIPDQDEEVKKAGDLKQPERDSNEEDSTKPFEEVESFSTSHTVKSGEDLNQEENNSIDKESCVQISTSPVVEIEDSLSQERVLSEDVDCKQVQGVESFSFNENQKEDSDLKNLQARDGENPKSNQGVEEVPELMQPDFSDFPSPISLELPQSSAPITIDLTDSPSENDSPAHRPRKRFKVDEAPWTSELYNNTDSECVSDTEKLNPGGEVARSDIVEVSKCQKTDQEMSLVRPLEPSGVESRSGRWDPNWTLCPYDISGICRDPNCSYQHFKP